MSTKEQPGPFDGLERAEPGEPVFTLRAHDDLAPGLVREWVFKRRRAIVSADLPEEKRSLELIQAREAEQVAENMEDWRNRATAPEPEPEKPSHKPAPVTLEPAELEAKARHDAHLDAARRFDNAVAEIFAAAETLAPYGFHRGGIELAAFYIQTAAEDVRPKRASYAHRGE
jgi:hypothetical protein